jgi:hypothetical protein
VHSASLIIEGKSKVIKHYLLHDKLLIRFGALLGMVLAVFLGIWTLSYLLLPEGIMRGRLVGQVLTGQELAWGSVWLEWLRIFTINLVVMLLIVIAPNLFRTEGGYPFGYITVTLMAVVNAITLGTNSFSFSLGGKIPPSLIIFGSSGLYEIIAFVLAAAATVSISKFHLLGKWPKQTIEAILPPKTKSAIQERLVGIILAIMILLITCGWEAYRISQVIAP